MNKKYFLVLFVYLLFNTLFAQITQTIKAPSGIQNFGKNITLLKNGNFVVTSGNSKGSVSLYNGQTLQLISSLTGTTLSDKLGSDGIIPLKNGNFVVLSPYWDNGSLVDAGAITLINGTTGLSGTINTSNSLVGSSAKDLLGLSKPISGTYAYGGVLELSNGNVVVFNPNWDNGSAVDAGAVTWMNGTTGKVGTINSTNSLVGTQTSDLIGGGLSNGINAFALSNGNYLVQSYYWDNGVITDAGAATFGNGATGSIGEVSSTNSLIGSSISDHVGGVIYEVGSSNYVVCSSLWDNGPITDAGAATWGNGTLGVTGTINTFNSLVGSSSGDNIGYKLALLKNSNYILYSHTWDNGSISNAGAVTWANGNTGINGTVNSSNSYIGSQTNDYIPSGVLPLKNGDYVLYAQNWSNGIFQRAGLVAKGNGSSGLVGVASKTNALVGTYTNDYMGTVNELPNGNIIVSSAYWDFYDYGIVMLFHKDSAMLGEVTASRGLVGKSGSDKVGYNIEIFSNGNFIVQSYDYKNGSALGAGSVTLVDGNTGLKGVVNSTNSLIGSSTNDHIGFMDDFTGSYGIPGIKILKNGHFVVPSPGWDNGSISNAGAITWVNGTSGLIGTISSSNSLVGSSKNDWVGNCDSAYQKQGVYELTNGNYIIQSPTWNNGAVTNAGAITWASGTAPITGTINSSNSLVGLNTQDLLGIIEPTTLNNGNYVINSPYWDNGSNINTGAITWGNGTTGIVGSINQSNSLVGTEKNERLGSGGIMPLSNGNYVVRHPFWRYSPNTINNGAIIWGDGTKGVSGLISSQNALVDSNNNSQLGYEGVMALPNGNYLVKSESYYFQQSAVSMSCGGAPLNGFLDSTYSIICKTINGSSNSIIYPVYDSTNTQLLVGMQGNSDNMVKVFKCGAANIQKTFHKSSPISMLIFPNPTLGHFQIQSEFNMDKIEIYDMQGKKLFEATPNQKTLEVNLYSKGIYIVKMISNQQVWAQKVIVGE